MINTCSITFICEKVNFFLKDKKRIQNWIRTTIQTEKQAGGTLCFVFCTDGHLLEMNKKFLKHDYYTDILSFDYSTPSEKNKNVRIISGDLLISLDRVMENAKELGHNFDEELRRVMIHGILHLLGYSDKTVSEKAKMRKKENACLANY